MREGGNASLIEISIAAMIMVGSMALVSTMEPTVTALSPTTSDQGYMESVMDAFVLSGLDAEAFVEDIFVDGVDDGDSPVGTAWLDEALDDYSIYLNTGYHRFLLYGQERVGHTSSIPYVVHASEPSLFAPDEEFYPGEVRYNEDLLGDFFPPLGNDLRVDNVVHQEPFWDGLDFIAVNSPYTQSPDGRSWVDVWDQAVVNGTIPVDVPYGMWQIEMSYEILPLIRVTEFHDWSVFYGPDADAGDSQYAMYLLEVVT